MKTSPRFRILPGLLVLLGLGVSFTGCDRRKDDRPKPDYTTEANELKKDAFVELTFTEAHAFADEAATTGAVNTRTTQSLLPSCATVTHNTTTVPSQIVIDFGPTNCLGNDGRLRRGKILVSYTGPYRQPGTEINISFDNYFVNDHQLLGLKTITNLGRNAATNFFNFSVVVNGQVNFSTGDSTTWQASRNREWIAGDSTLFLADDVYRLTGSGSGVRANGQPFSHQILAPLVRKLAVGCRRHFIAGQLQITVGNNPVRLVDYGNGACDNIATVTVNGQTYTIQLP